MLRLLYEFSPTVSLRFILMLAPLPRLNCVHLMRIQQAAVHNPCLGTACIACPLLRGERSRHLAERERAQ